jgi:hypothetical protein
MVKIETHQVKWDEYGGAGPVPEPGGCHPYRHACHGGPYSIARGEATGGGPLPPSRPARWVEVEGALLAMVVRPTLTRDGDDVAGCGVSGEGREGILGLWVWVESHR